MMNKKGDVPTILLFLVALLSVISTLYAFATFNGDLETQSKELSELVTEIEFSEQYVKEQAKLLVWETVAFCPSCSIAEIDNSFKENADSKDLAISKAGNFFGKIRNSDYEIYENEDNYELIIVDLFVQTEKGENKIIRNFDICMFFNLQGNFVKECELDRTELL